MKVAEKQPVYIIAGIIPLRSVKMAHFLNEKVPGINVPATMIERLDKSSDPIETGSEIAVEVIKGLQEVSHGIHLMVVGGKEKDFDLLQRLSFLEERHDG
jgi:5,10-methylenetetrahydrofolate reductase